MKDYIEEIIKAPVYEVAQVTPYERAPKLSKRLQNEIFLKREDLQDIFSFKIRGAFNKIASLSQQERERGIIAASAGNHAQGVALSARYFDCPAKIVMPDTTPSIKIDAVKELGAEVVIEGGNYTESEKIAHEIAAKDSLTFVHAFDDPKVIAGQGTVATELIRQASPLPDVLFVCVGGGGLLAGVSVFLKQLYPQIKLIGVEHKHAPTHFKAREAGKPVELDYVSTFADGAAVKKAGIETYALISKYVDEIMLVNADSICAAIKDVFEDTRTILEPAGALAVAGMKAYVAREGIKDAYLAAITTGSNINFTRLRNVAERAELGADKEAVFAVGIPERPGSFKAFCSVLGEYNITEFNYRYHNFKEAQIFVGVGIESSKDREGLINKFKKAGFSALDLSNNEIAKNHIRYAVGGRNPNLKNERFFSFRFPERPGALMQFLERLPEGWNISFFHYRNHGSVMSRLLVGLQIPEADGETYEGQIAAIGYTFREQTDNSACQLFL